MQSSPAETATRDDGVFDVRELGGLGIADEEILRKIPHYDALKTVVLRSGVPFRVFAPALATRSDHALLLNVVFWNASAVDDVIERPVVSAYSLPHIAWHHLASRELRPATGSLSADAQIFGESVASAFDFFILGHLLRIDPQYPLTQALVNGLHGAVLTAGGTADTLRGLAASVRDDPDAAFSDVRELLYTGTQALYDCATAEEALAVLLELDAHPLGTIFHRHRVADWLLQIRASGGARHDPSTAELAAGLGAAEHPIEWLLERWLTPAEREPASAATG